MPLAGRCGRAGAGHWARRARRLQLRVGGSGRGRDWAASGSSRVGIGFEWGREHQAELGSGSGSSGSGRARGSGRGVRIGTERARGTPSGVSIGTERGQDRDPERGRGHRAGSGPGRSRSGQRAGLGAAAAPPPRQGALWRAAAGTSVAGGRRAGDGGAVPQLRVGPRADRGADGAAAGGILQLPRALARPPRHPGQHRALAPTGVQRRDFRLLNPAGEALHDGFHPQCTHLRFGLAVLHPPRKAVPGFHRHRSLLPPAGLLDLQLALPLDADVVAGAHRVHGADGGHRRVPVHENRAAGDPPQLRPQIQRIDCRWQPRAAFCHCSQHNASNASESSLKKHSRSV